MIAAIIFVQFRAMIRPNVEIKQRMFPNSS